MRLISGKGALMRLYGRISRPRLGGGLLVLFAVLALISWATTRDRKSVV